VQVTLICHIACRLCWAGSGILQLAARRFYRYCAAHDLIGRVPTEGVARPVVEPDYTATVRTAAVLCRAALPQNPRGGSVSFRSINRVIPGGAKVCELGSYCLRQLGV
jgi:hypothetical protein